VIETRELTRRFGDYDAVHGLSIRVEPGEWFLLAGPNGAGKTTTMRLLMGILQPDAGSSSICGHDPAVDPTSVRRLIGYLPERFFPYEHLTGREYLELAARAYGMAPRAARDQVAIVLDLVDLAREQADQLMKGYSFGMTKKVAFGAAIVHQPRVLLLDEPTAGLDPRGARRIYDVIGELVRHGATCLMSSHLLLEVQDICDRVGFIDKGRLMQILSLDTLHETGRTLPELFLDLVSWPTKPDMAAFFAAAPGVPRPPASP